MGIGVGKANRSRPALGRQTKASTTAKSGIKWPTKAHSQGSNRSSEQAQSRTKPNPLRPGEYFWGKPFFFFFLLNYKLFIDGAKLDYLEMLADFIFLTISPGF